jgi:F-type H+-transporting ATPase subunit b
MKPRLLPLVAALGLGAALSAGIALGQQPPPSPGPQRPAPGQPIDIRKIDPSQLPPAFRQPGNPFMPGGQPGQPGGQPGNPHAKPPPGKRPPVRRVAPPPEPEESGGHHEEEEFPPGHGPTEPPSPPNWWRGILMVDDDLAKSSNPAYQLLFREKGQPPPFLASLLNFGILAFVLYRFGRKPLAEALVKRKQAIMGEIDNATKLKKDAEDRLRDLQDKLDRMEDTLAELHAEFALSAEEEKKHVLAEAEERRVRMRRDAEFRIEQELKSARAELLQEAVANAVLAAEEILAKQVGASDLDRLAEDYLSSVGAALSGATAAPQGARS